MLHGNAYLELVMTSEGGLGELHCLRSDRMAVVPGADGWPVAYDYSVGGRKHRFEMQGDLAPICHLKSFHPLDDHYGLAPIQAAAFAIDVHNSASSWSKALLDNAARPSGAIVYGGVDGQAHMSAEQYDRLIHEMETHHQGARNAGRPMLLEGGLDWKPMGFSRLIWNFRKAKRPPPVRWPQPLACRRCCWGFRAMRPMPIMRRPTVPFTAMQALDGAQGMLELQVAQLSESFGPGLFRKFRFTI
jgi:HK97 family phage portal protein